MAKLEELLQAPIVLSRGVFVEAVSPAETRIRCGLLSGAVYSLADATASGLWETFLADLDGTNTVGELIARWPESERTSVLRLIATLMERRVLVLPAASAAASLREGLNACLPTAFQERVSTAHIMLVGAGVLGSRVGVNLALTGVGRISIYDPERLSEAERLLSPVYGDAQPGSSRAECLSEALRRIVPGLTVRAVPELQDAIDGCSFLVLAQDFLIPGVCDQINRLSMERGFPWTLLALDGNRAVVGPTVHPGQTPCYQCLEAYWISHTKQSEQLVALLNRFRDGRPGQAYFGIPAVADLVAGLFGTDLPGLLAQGPALTLGQVLMIDVPALTSRIHTIPRVPRCPACGGQRYQAAADRS